MPTILMVILLGLPGGEVHRRVEQAPSVEVCVQRGRENQRVVEAYVRDQKLPIENLVLRHLCYEYKRAPNDL